MGKDRWESIKQHSSFDQRYRSVTHARSFEATIRNAEVKPQVYNMRLELLLSLAPLLIVVTSAQEILREDNGIETTTKNQTSTPSPLDNSTAVSSEALGVYANIRNEEEDMDKNIEAETYNESTTIRNDNDIEEENPTVTVADQAGRDEEVDGDEENSGTDVPPETDPDPEPDLDPIIVQTTYGAVKGVLLKEETLVGYFDIPYGQFDEYFKAPSEPEVWVDTLGNLEHKTLCPQLNQDTVIGSMDCLTLSIFTPVHAENAPVLFHIHDGEFKHGSGDPAIYGPEHLVSKGVILVLPNYRLGPLGFLCMRNDTAPGNAALKDLTLALQWTANNIAAFGGDANNIAVSGEGLSGALVGYLALSPKSSLYISKAITESGSVLSHMVIDRDPLATASELGQPWAPGETTRTIVGLGYEEMILYSKDLDFRPCVETTEDSFINVVPWELLQSRTNITFMIGSTTHAGYHDFLEQAYTIESATELNEDMIYLVPNDLVFNSEDERTAMALNIKRHYFGNNNITMDNVDQLILYYTDASYLGPAIRTARPLVEAGATVYFYEFSFVGEFNREHLTTETVLTAATRGDVIKYLFTQDGTLPEEDSEEQVVVDLMTDLWVTFMQTGIPKATNINWNKLKLGEESEEEWLSIGAEAALVKGLHVDRLSLWSDLYKTHFVDSNSGTRATSHLPVALSAAMLLLAWDSIVLTSMS